VVTAEQNSPTRGLRSLVCLTNLRSLGTESKTDSGGAQSPSPGVQLCYQNKVAESGVRLEATFSKGAPTE
jgi:hypothetical protein